MDSQFESNSSGPLNLSGSRGPFNGLTVTEPERVNALTRLLKESPAEVVVPMGAIAADLLIAWWMTDVQATAQLIGMGSIALLITALGGSATYFIHQGRKRAIDVENCFTRDEAAEFGA